MKIFDAHLKGAKAHNENDIVWLLACYAPKLTALCRDPDNGYKVDEDMLIYIAGEFVNYLDAFTIFENDAPSIHKRGEGK